VFATIQKWGNSHGLRIPKAILESALLKENDKVEINVQDNIITIRKAEKKYRNLDELFAGYKGDYKCTEYDTGDPAGKEVL